MDANIVTVADAPLKIPRHLYSLNTKLNQWLDQREGRATTPIDASRVTVRPLTPQERAEREARLAAREETTEKPPRNYRRRYPKLPRNGVPSHTQVAEKSALADSGSASDQPTGPTELDGNQESAGPAESAPPAPSPAQVAEACEAATGSRHGDSQLARHLTRHEFAHRHLDASLSPGLPGGHAASGHDLSRGLLPPAHGVLDSAGAPQRLRCRTGPDLPDATQGMA